MSKLNNIYLIVGKSGCGKTTVCDLLEKDCGYKQLRSYTTRPPRHSKENNHIFLSSEEFDKLNHVVAFTNYNGYRYCATKEQVDESDLYVIDELGIENMKEKYDGVKGVKVIYLQCNSLVRSTRMLKRGDSTEDIYKRLEYDSDSFCKAEEIADTTISVSNLNINQVKTEVQNFINVEENKGFPQYEEVIYISHPYGGKENNKKTISKIVQTLSKEYPRYLFISPVHMFSPLYDDTDYAKGLQYCLYMLKYCSQLWVFGDWWTSVGCKKEIEFASSNGMQIVINKK